MKFLAFAVLIVILYFIAKKAFAPMSGLTPAEAAKLLDVAADADIETVVAAHKRLITKVHPDAGGSAELAARINQARDVLLRRLSR
jgi:DnaJ homolog subfamily C member 19